MGHRGNRESNGTSCASQSEQILVSESYEYCRSKEDNVRLFSTKAAGKATLSSVCRQQVLSEQRALGSILPPRKRNLAGIISL